MKRGLVFLGSLMLNIVLMIIVAALAVTNSPAAATEFTISPSQSIQTKINEAVDEDIIILGPGTYVGNINFSGKAITIKSTDPNNWDVVAATIIDGNQTGSVVIFNSGEGSASVLRGITIKHGQDEFGGGIYCESSSPSISNCSITGNTTFSVDEYGYGGGIYCYNSPGLNIVNCTITENSSDWGGGICCDYSSPIITNCIITKNSASVFGEGGGIYCESSSPCFKNCTICGNSASTGGGIGCYCSSPYMVNSIFWDNGSEIHTASGSHPKLSYCDIQGGYQGLGNIDADPLFIDPNNDYSLGSISPCIDKGHLRIYDSDLSRSDIGAYGGEGGFDQNSITITVAKDENGDYESIQDAIDYAVPGDTVTVFSGTYEENVVIVDKDIFLISKNGMNSTIIDGSFQGSVIYLANIGFDTTVDGFTIQNGGNSSNGDGINGGGISCHFCSSPGISNCIIRGNSTSKDGGGIYCDFSSPIISNCIITDNEGDWGGGICCDYISSPSISNCKISRNRASSGGGIECYYAFPNITNCLISENFAEDYGGGIYCFFSSPMFSNCIITDNEGDWGGGICCDNTSSPSFTNCTMSRNVAFGGGGGGVECYDSSEPIFINCIFWGDSPEEIHLFESTPSITITITYSNIHGGYDGSGNINANPLFVDPNAGNYHMMSVSPCIDVGTPNISALPSTDIDGNPRIMNGRPDMGAYEYFTELFTLYSGLNLASFPQGLGNSSLTGENIPFFKILIYQPETSNWRILGPADEENFSLSLGEGWLVYLNQEVPKIDFYFPNAGSPLEFDPNEDFLPGLNFLNFYSLSEILTIDNVNGQLMTWPENLFLTCIQETGKEPASVLSYDRLQGKWQANYQFFGRMAGPESELKKEGYILYLQ